jgi:2-polyprenyl-3-methyl-5-hydroxy-6-metoxy-1,4-benzoquinol methylase
VDVVADGATYQTAEPVDCIVCCEVLEHAANWQGIIVNAAHLLRTGGHLIVTAAAKPRPAHSALDGGAMRQGEYYENIDPQDLSMFAQHFGLHIVMLEYDGVAGDVRLLAVKYG